MPEPRNLEIVWSSDPSSILTPLALLREDSVPYLYIAFYLTVLR